MLRAKEIYKFVISGNKTNEYKSKYMKSRVPTDYLKELSRNEESFNKLRELYDQIIKERDTLAQNLELFESAVRSDYDSIVITELDLEDPGPKIVFVNDGFCKMTGYTREEVIGKTPRILQGPKTDTAVLERLKKCLSEGQSFFGQAINYRKDGTEFVNQWDIHPLTDSEGNITHWVSYQHDITERKRAEKVLVETQMEFDGLREASKRTVLDVNFQGDIVMANKSFRQLTGYSKNEFRDMKVWDLFPRKYRDSLRSRFVKDKEQENFSNQSFRGIIKHRSGIPIQIEGQTRILELKDDVLIRAEISNISMQKRIMETLKRRNRDYSIIFEKVSEFTYQVVSSDEQFHYDYFSDEFPKITGLSPQEVRENGDGIRKFVHKDDVGKVEEHFKKICAGQECTCEYRIRNKEGDFIRIVDYGRRKQYDPVSNVTYIHGAVSLIDS